MRTFVTGPGGFLGRTVVETLQGLNVPPLFYWPGTSPDLRTAKGADRFSMDLRFALAEEPLTVVHCAFPGSDGIGTMRDTPATLVHDQLLIDLHVVRACAEAKVPHLITFGSVCAYPDLEISGAYEEDDLWNGPPETLNAPYGSAKRMLLALLNAYSRQSGLTWTHLILDNLYGPGDSTGHVIPATIQKCLLATMLGKREIIAWGNGNAEREFVYVNDAAQAVVAAIKNPPPQGNGNIYNIVSGDPMQMRAIVQRVAEACDYTGDVLWDESKPVGQRFRYFNGDKAVYGLNWRPATPFTAGLAATVKWAKDGGLRW